MSELSDEKLEKILRIMGHFAIGSLDEVSSFEGKNDQDREEILKVALRSGEIAMMVFLKLMKDLPFDDERIDKLCSLLAEEKYEEVDMLMSKV